MKRWLPFPVLSLLLFLSWILLAADLSAAHLLLAAVLAIAIPMIVAAFLDHLPPVQSRLAAVRLLLLVTWDIVVANVVVARLVLGPIQKLRPAFVTVPLDIQNPQAIALLASIITMTPGTVSADLSADQRSLLVHALDCEDAQSLVADIKSRYEKPLQEIFAC